MQKKYEKCKDCPYLKKNKRYYCSRSSPFSGFSGMAMGILGRVIEDIEDIPDWCPEIIEDLIE
jgi:hypothetical protein